MDTTKKVIIGRRPIGTGTDADYSQQIEELKNLFEGLQNTSVLVGADGKIDPDLIPASVISPITSVNSRKEGDIVLNADDIVETEARKYFTEERVRGFKLATYTKPNASRAITQNDTLETAIGLTEAGVSESKTVAQNAQDLAAAASSAATTATSTANNANSAASTAATQAGNAVSTANTASSLANTASTTANNALTLAQKAVPVNATGTIDPIYLGGLLEKEIVDYPSFANFPATGDANKIYVDKSDANKKYEWSGTQYTQLGGGIGQVTINNITSANHVIDAAKVGLGDVPNVDATNPMNIKQTATYRLVTDVEKTAWSGKQAALGYTPIPNTRKVNNKILTSDISLNKTDIGLGDVPNVDATNPANIGWTDAITTVSKTEKQGWNAGIAMVDSVADVLVLTTGTTTWEHNPAKPNKYGTIDKATLFAPTNLAEGNYFNLDMMMDGTGKYALEFAGVAPDNWATLIAEGKDGPYAKLNFSGYRSKTTLMWGVKFNGFGNNKLVKPVFTATDLGATGTRLEYPLSSGANRYVFTRITKASYDTAIANGTSPTWGGTQIIDQAPYSPFVLKRDSAQTGSTSFMPAGTWYLRMQAQDTTGAKQSSDFHIVGPFTKS